MCRNSGVQPFVIGNGGYVQLNTPDHHQVHFWGHPRVPRNTLRMQPHSHSTSFSSTVLRGRMVNIIYELTLDTSHFGFHKTKMQLESWRGNQVPIGVTHASIRETSIIDIGETYGMSARDYHEGFPPAGELAVTFWTPETHVTNDNPCTLVRCTDRYIEHKAMPSTAQLWDIIGEFLRDKPTGVNES
jgi:hypothetical protein